MRYAVRVATEPEQTAYYTQEKDRMKTIRRRKIEIETEIKKGRERKFKQERKKETHTTRESISQYGCTVKRVGFAQGCGVRFS